MSTIFKALFFVTRLYRLFLFFQIISSFLFCSLGEFFLHYFLVDLSFLWLWTKNGWRNKNVTEICSSTKVLQIQWIPFSDYGAVHRASLEKDLNLLDITNRTMKFCCNQKRKK
ncbi:uncharacterized protein LOC107830150 [Nicotiana tabacum]|uniref:Uncharacterized protein LOC107830150 n=1 Tax=Nicotiana tabacum TaxID=4097 RepID=A0AC58RWN0_TOBAC